MEKPGAMNYYQLISFNKFC